MIFGPNPSQWRQPFLSINIFTFLKITQIFLILFSFGFRLRFSSNDFLGPTPASGRNLSASLEIQKLTLLKNLGNQNFSEFKTEFPVEFFLKFYGDN